MKRKKIVVFSGAGISAESGLKTFRDSDGLWENYNIMEVATPEAWLKNPVLVLEFYNKRRQQVMAARPNTAHYAIAELEEQFDVQVITQNIDDLHERAGSTNVLHLHGEILKAKSSVDPHLVYAIDGPDLNIGEKCEKGSQLRPHVVWFGEPVPMMEEAFSMAAMADIMLIVGTSLNVYPAAGIIHYVPEPSQKFLIDPQHIPMADIENLTVYTENAGSGVPKVVKSLLGNVSPANREKE